ncbi:MAG: hypothetical protein QNJ09_11795 [Paracoccaceae bacterium]|nr:hypothetical protein [Paracoccaceae bacterium]
MQTSSALEAQLQAHFDSREWKASIAERKNCLTRTGYALVSDILPAEMKKAPMVAETYSKQR